MEYSVLVRHKLWRALPLLPWRQDPLLVKPSDGKPDCPGDALAVLLGSISLKKEVLGNH